MTVSALSFLQNFCLQETKVTGTGVLDCDGEYYFWYRK